MASPKYTPRALVRITRDTAVVTKEGAVHGHFWIPSETCVGRGHAIIMGPEGTPYDCGAFCFDVTFPANYPFEPPKFTYLTNDGKGTRFNPNLYTCGKVCLSLLGTWPGEPWSATQTLSSVLLSIQSMVLVEFPLENEPAFYTARSTKRPLFDEYNRIVTHAVLETAILGHLKRTPDFVKSVPSVKEAIEQWIAKGRERVIKKARDYAALWADGKSEHGKGAFGLSVTYRFKAMATELERFALVPAPSTAAVGGAGTKIADETCEF